MLKYLQMLLSHLSQLLVANYSDFKHEVGLLMTEQNHLASRKKKNRLFPPVCQITSSPEKAK